MQHVYKLIWIPNFMENNLTLIETKNKSAHPFSIYIFIYILMKDKINFIPRGAWK